jgi:hypothetical protein
MHCWLVLYMCKAKQCAEALPRACRYPPRKKHGLDPRMRLSGLEPMIYTPDPKAPRTTFLNVGERCNVAGSMLYKKAIVDGDYDKAHAIALKQASCHRMTAVSVSAMPDAEAVHTCVLSMPKLPICSVTSALYTPALRLCHTWR